jgi:hypothetical protein
MPDPRSIERVRELAEPGAEVDTIVGHWLRRFTACADPRLRRVILAECVRGIDDAALVGALARLDGRALAGDQDCRWIGTELALAPSVLHDLDYERRSDLYMLARDAGLPEVAAKFLAGGAAPDAPTANPHLDLSAGERTARARGRDRLLLDRLLHDRDPRVIAALLDNPRLSERDVVKIAAMRPTRPEVLDCIAAHPRWATRYRVRKALAFNPATPPPLARALLPTLLQQDLAELVGSAVVVKELRDAVAALTARRRA